MAADTQRSSDVGTLACQDEYIFLDIDPVTGQQSLISTVTQERCALEGEWEFGYHQRLAFVAAEGGVALWATQVLSMHVYKSSGGEFFWMEGEGALRQRVDLADKVRASAQCEVTMGKNIAHRKLFKMHRTDLSRDGSHYWVFLLDVVKALGMRPPDGKPWSYNYYKSWTRWDHNLKEMGSSTRLRPSVPYRVGGEGGGGGWRILPGATMSLHNLLMYLYKNAFAPRHLGGPTSQEVAQDSSYLLREFVLRAKPPLCLNIFLFGYEWPPPSTRSANRWWHSTSARTCASTWAAYVWQWSTSVTAGR